MQNKNLESRIQNVECKIKPKDKILKSLNPKFYQLNSTKKAFTLVELIVTIVVLAILTTISFLSFQGFSKSSRDSVRISDIDNIEKNLGLFIVNTGYYPTPDNPTSITYKGGLAWVQGTIGDNVTKNIENINKKPIDPLTNSEYAYSITNNKREYQIGTIIEDASTAYIKENLLTQKTYALGTKKVIAKIKGTYNEKIIKVSTGGVSYVLAIPSIITSNLNNTDIESIISNKELVYNDYSNVPDSYKTSGYSMTGGFDFSPQELVAYSGSSIDFTNNENKIDFVTNLQKIYSGTVVEGTNTYDEIMKIDTIGEPDKAVNLINNYIINNVGGISGKITTVFFNSCTLDGQTINHNQQVTAYSENNISYGSSYSCIDRAQTRTCVDGVLSGSEDYKYSNCIKGDPTNCDASGSYLYYSHTYSIPLINHAEILTGVLSTGVSENNGIYSYILSSIECNDGNLINPIEEENPTVISCNTGYTISGNSCVTATYTISGDFGTNASGATVDVCGSDVIADENGIFSTTRNYGSTCDTISALRTGYTCSTTTQGPTILTENVSNILGLCSINSYTVTFDGNGGTGHTPTSKSVTYNSSIGTLPTNPTKDGYTFVGWYTQSTGGSQITESTTVLGDATVYAQWNVNNYTVIFDGNGGTGHTPTSKSVTYNTAIGTLPSTPTMTGYTFNGWYTSASGGTQITES
ncbi:MAG: InlB B-repeat-containing protein, partial [Candidatus Gracilibacteria bacterium]|nr:InlB B-repeat-containing protein [Candidatus Gracilibacteria bacterium]